ncbi:MAG: RHS repeat domain-containing protein [Pyrinomonadaceae bacterium]
MKASKQTTDGVEYGGSGSPCAMTYNYNVSGALVNQQYPSCRIVENTIDPTGNLSEIKTSKTGGALSSYANSFTYNAAGAVTSMRLGNGLWESTEFNSRLQPEQIALGTTQNGHNKLKLNYSYGGSQNNGNVLSQTITVPSGFTATQTYNYDALNRLKDATEVVSGNQSWTQVFGYDRFGNRNITSGVGVTSFSFSGNRITAHSYDNAGNTTADGTGKTFTYDAENKQKTAVVGGYTNQYFYDGDGRRVKKVVPSTGEVTIFVYDAMGKQIAEYSTVVAAAQDAKVAYLTADQLGSPRINTDATGTVIARHDYHPFGEEIFTAQRTGGLGYAADTVRKQFTGYERDNESGLDFAQARMFGSSLGRFTAVDPLSASASPSNPQTFNRYTYVLNNPMVMTDPTGLIGDYYYDDGRYIGNDGKNDGKYYTATVDKRDITPEGEMIYVSNVKERPTAETMGIRALNASLGATADAAIFGKLKGAANFLINNTTAGLLGIIPNVEYANQAEASHGTATQVGLGLGTVAAGSVFSAGASAVSVVPKAPPPSYPPGSFSIVDWAGYPAGPRPTGPFRLIEGAEYDTARSLANAANKQLHANNPGLKGLQIHEIHPVKFGGSPTNAANKIPLDPASHRQFNTFWDSLRRSLK